MRSILKDAVIDRLLVSQAAAGLTETTNNSASIDCADAENVLFLVELGAISTGGLCTCKVQQSDDNSTFSDVAGTSVVNSGDSAADKILAIEVLNPQARYLRVVTTRSTANVEIDSIIAIKHGAKKVPVSQSSDVDASEVHASPDAGIA